jgi:hypothetical protein
VILDRHHSSTSALSIIAGVLFLSPSVVFARPSRAAIPPFTAEELMSRFENSSAHDVLAYLTKIENERTPLWDYFCDRVETGDIDWLKLVILVSPASDGAVSEDLNAALAEATTRAPAPVLLLFGAHCFVPDYRLPRSKKQLVAEIDR